jgi:superkiller protein 3
MGSKCSNFTKCTKCAKDLRNEPSRKEAEFERNQEIESSLKESLIHFSLDDSLLTIEKIINKYSNNPEVLLKVACHLHDKKKIGESKEIFEKILGEGDPLDLKSAVSYIKIHIQEKKYEIGRVMVEEYLERFPESDQLFYLLAEIYSIQNESGLAKASIKKALKLDPDNPEYHNVYGLSLMKDKKYEKALKEFEKAFELDQFMAKAMNNAGNAYRKLGNTSEAIKCYNNAIDLVPKRKFPIALINLATTCFYTGDVLSTLNFFEEALQTGSNIHKIMVKKGYHLLFKNPKTKQAIESLLKQEVNKSILLFHEILKNDPNNPVVTFYLASALLKQNKINEAHDMFRNCIE